MEDIFLLIDLIAQGVSPFSPEAAAFRAGRLMLEEIDLCAKRGESFGFETTLSGRSYLSLIRRLMKQGYEVHFFYLWVPIVELNRQGPGRLRISQGATVEFSTEYPTTRSQALTLSPLPNPSRAR